MRRTVLLLFLCIFNFASYASDDLKEAKAIAHQDFKEFIASCLTDDGARDHFQLQKNDVISNAMLGEPYKLGIISSNQIRGFTASKRIGECYSTINTYLFPVIFNNRIKGMISVEKYSNNEPYAIGSFGFKWLGIELEKVLQVWSPSDGYSLLLLQNPQTHQYLFHIPQKDTQNLTCVDYESGNKTQFYTQLNSISGAMKTLHTRLDEFKMGGN